MAQRTPIIAGAVAVLLVPFWRWPFSPAGRTRRNRRALSTWSSCYCVTDRETAQELIDQFEKETGIRVEAKFDTEAAKAIGLVQAIRQEKANPRCDVLWGGGAIVPRDARG